MRWALLPTNIFWVVGHIIMSAVGIFFTVIASQSVHKDILMGVGGSLIAAGIAGEILFLYVASSQQTKDKLDFARIIQRHVTDGDCSLLLKQVRVDLQLPAIAVNFVFVVKYVRLLFRLEVYDLIAPFIGLN
jgi:ABC-type uncharacterized transport system permease subunit